jgi:release factor glutamine methyltransferase
VTVLETIQRSTEFLARKGIDSPRLQAELLLAHLLRVPRMKLYLDFERTLTEPEVNNMRDLVKRRSHREPLQHIVGSTSFCGLEFLVNRQVLVPRPETELLAECGWQFVQGLSSARRLPAGGEGLAPSVLDYGTGSGCLAVTLAVKCPDALVQAVDISPEAIAVARENASRHGVAERICFRTGNGFEIVPVEERFDLIISNPPYIPTADIESLQPEVRDFDPRTALDGGADGVEHYRILAAQAGAYLRPGGKLIFEFGDGQSETIQEVLLRQNWVVERVADDYNQRPRIMIAHNVAESARRADACDEPT